MQESARSQENINDRNISMRYLLYKQQRMYMKRKVRENSFGRANAFFERQQ